MKAFDELFRVIARNMNLEDKNLYVDFTIRNTIIEYPSFCSALKRITKLHQRGLTADVAGGLLITGQTGSGKTTVAKFYRDYFPRQELEDRTVIPVLLVTTPQSPTVKSLAEAILIALGDPAAGKGTGEEKSRRIFRYLKECRVELLIVDEFQHFWDSRQLSEARKVTDWLKNVFNIANLPVVLVGLPRSVMVLEMNPQLKRRFSAPFYLKPFTFEEKQGRAAFRGVLKMIHSKLPVECPPLHETNLARQFYFASCGLIDYLAKIVDRAVQLVGEVGRKALRVQDFARAFEEEIWREAPKRLNPFNPKAILRPLTKRGEPFDLWDDPGKYNGQGQAREKDSK